MDRLILLSFNSLKLEDWVNCCWSSLAQSFLVPSHMGLMNLLSRVGCITRQITSCCIGSSEFISHSLLHLHSSQFYNYCHWQYHTYFSCCHSLRRMLDCSWLGDFMIHNVSLLITHSGHILFSWLFIPFPVASCYSGVPSYFTVVSGVISPWGKGAECWLACYRSSDSALMLLRHCWRGRGCPA
jgi:hypothetical protein